jgi:TrpR family trp operon transcriptional repressor
LSQWLQLSKLIGESNNSDLTLDKLLRLIITPDECEIFITRAEIFRLLLEGKLSQRQICQTLGVGIATVTRGSNELKKQSSEERAQLITFLNTVLPKRDE